MSTWETGNKKIHIGDEVANVEKITAETIKEVARDYGLQRFNVSSDEYGDTLLGPESNLSEMNEVFIHSKEKVA